MSARILVSFVLVMWVSPVGAAPPEFPRLKGLFERKKKEDEAPAKVKQLLETLKSDTDEKKRKAAAENLAEQDARANADIQTGLIASLRQDPAVAVRTAAAESIGKLKPVSSPAGVALEEAVQSDPSDAVRKAAQGALFQYHLNGYKGNPTGSTQSTEPPLAKSKGKAAPAAVPASRPAPPSPLPVSIGRGANPKQSAEPPLVRPKPAPTPPPAPAVTTPDPTGPTVIPPSGVSIPNVPSVTPPPMLNAIPGIPTIPVPKG